MRQTFARQPESVPTARHFVAQAIAGAPKDVGDRVAVMVSELATNAIQHGRTDFVVHVESDDSRIHVEITDSGSGEPTVQMAEARDLSGRGLKIVEVLSDEWGVRRDPQGTGKSVWFVVQVPSET